jgi:3-phenylpropionate/cinnamic acid dioxygenase small subunit
MKREDAALSPTAVAIAVPETLRREIEAFLFLEARLADESRYAEWEALATDDMHYWVPKGRADYDPATRLSYINDNRSRLATRIRQLKSGLRHAQSPASPMRRVVSNLEVLACDEEKGEYLVTSNFVVFELAVQSTAALRLWPGRAIHRLRRVDGALRMAAKTIELVTASEPQPNLTFLL